MGYRADGKLEEFGRVEPFLEAQRRTVRRVGEELYRLTVENTPVAEPPPGVDQAEWIRARRGRTPGTLKRSWRLGEVEVIAGGERMRIEVFTHDETAPHVEYPTRPHIITPRNPRGWLRFWDRFGGTVFAKVVHHPGTHGSFMFTRALAEVALLWQAIGAEEMQRWAREQEQLVA